MYAQVATGAVNGYHRCVLQRSIRVAFLPLHGETDEQRYFGLTIPVRGWTVDFSNFQTHARNFFDHDVLGNSNIFFPLSIERARIHGWESTVRSPHIRKHLDVYLTYSNQMAEGAGVITGGLLSNPGQLCDGGGFCCLDHDQRNTLSAGFHVALPLSISASGNLSYGSGFLNGNGPTHLSDHTEVSLSLSKAIGERLSVGFTGQNIADDRYLLDNSNTFGENTETIRVRSAEKFAIDSTSKHLFEIPLCRSKAILFYAGSRKLATAR